MMTNQKIDEAIDRILDASAAVAHAEGIYSAGARRELDEAIAAVKALAAAPSEANTAAEVAHFGVVERYISDLRSKATSLTDDEFTLIAGNLRGFYATILPLGPHEPTTMALLQEAETAIEEYSCRTPVPHIASEMEGLAARIRSFLSGSRSNANV